MNPRLALLKAYPFERPRQLPAGHAAPARKVSINLSTVEPRHPTPQLVIGKLMDGVVPLSNYPMTAGTPALRHALSGSMSPPA